MTLQHLPAFDSVIRVLPIFRVRVPFLITIPGTGMGTGNSK